MKLKKTLALILALMMAACMFSACGEEKKEETPAAAVKEPAVAVSDEDSAKATMEEFAELYFAGDERALDYVDKNAQGYPALKEGLNSIKGVEEMFDAMSGQMGLPSEYDAEIKKIGTEFVDGIISKMGITVNDVKVDGDVAVLRCTFATPNMDELQNSFTEELMMEAIYSVFTEEEIEAIDSADEKTQAEAIIKLLDVMFDMIVDNIEVTSVEMEYTLKKTGNTWIITDSE